MQISTRAMKDFNSILMERMAHAIEDTYSQSDGQEPPYCAFCYHYIHRGHKETCIVPQVKEYLHGN